MKRSHLLISTAILIEIFLVSFVWFSGEASIPLYMFTYFEVSLVVAFCFYLIKKTRFSDVDKFRAAEFIIVTGIIFRITVFSSPPSTSPDVYRYVWEGKITYNGFNPYLTPPISEDAAEQKTKHWDKVGFKNISSVYPPFAQLIFVSSYLISGDEIWGMKLIMLLFEILTMFMILKLLNYFKKDPLNIILYAWLPLPIMEYLINVHIDTAGLSLLLVSIYYFEKKEIAASSLFFSLSFLTKLFPLFLLPLILKKAGVKNGIIFLSIFSVITVISYIPFYTTDFSFLNPLFNYAKNWEFNGSVYNLIKLFSNGEQARIVCYSLLIIVLILITLKSKTFIKGAFGILTAVVIFATTVYPWYLGWTAALNPLLGFYSMMYLFFSVNLSNFTPLGKVWQEYWRVLVIEYIPVFLLLIYDLKLVFLFPKKKNNDNEQNDS